MGAVGSDSLQLDVSNVLSSCQSGAKVMGCTAGCGQGSHPKSINGVSEEGAGDIHIHSCLACGTDCENNVGRNMCHLGNEEQIARSFGSHLEYGRYFEANPHSEKPLFEPGGLVRLQMSEPGTMKRALTDSYTLDLNPAGRGSYGEVYGATHCKSGARRAVKSINKATLRRYVKNVSGFIQREIDCLRRLDHPNIVRIYEAYENEEQTDLVLELCSGGDLLERLSLNHPRLPEIEAAELFGQMLGAIQHLYSRGVVHRDLKPENFLFTHREPDRDPLPPRSAPVKLIDFGLSRRLSAASGKTMTPKIGTAEYMAPEAFAGMLNATPIDAHRADMWSMGVVLHIIFLGHFPSAKLVEVPPDIYFANPCFSNISPDGVDVLCSLLRKDPHKRPTVGLVLRHPWLLMGRRLRSPQPPHTVPTAVHCWKQSSRLRHLALAAAAREVDDRHLCALRQIFQNLELQCEGALTRPALERASQGSDNIAMAAFVLHQDFSLLDIDGSDAIDWTEFVAAALSVTGMLSERASGNIQSIFDALDAARQSDGWHEDGGIGFDANGDDKSGQLLRSLNIPSLTNSACWSAFYLFSQDSGLVSGATLGHLLAPGEVNAWLRRGEKPGQGAPQIDDFRHVADLDHLVREVNASGAVNSNEFMTMLRGAAAIRGRFDSFFVQDAFTPASLAFPPVPAPVQR